MSADEGRSEDQGSPRASEVEARLDEPAVPADAPPDASSNTAKDGEIPGERARIKTPRSPEGRPPASHLGGLPRPLALAVLGLWALLTLAAVVSRARGASPDLGEDALLPAEHRPSDDRPLALLRVDLDALERTKSEAKDGAPETDLVDPGGLDARAALAEAGFAIEEAFGSERVPYGPPKTEITRWLDAHALYLLPVETHAALAERLSDAQMLAEVQGLEARMGSPLFSVSGEQPRRDPLGLSALTKREAGRMGHVATTLGSAAPQIGPGGDLVSGRGDRALVQLVSTRPPDALEADLRAALDGLPVEAELLDPRRRSTRGAEVLAADARAALIACFAALVVLASLSLRKVGPVLALSASLASAWWIAAAVLARAGLGLDLVGSALLMATLGFACDAALGHGHGREGERARSMRERWRELWRGGLATLIGASALLPLLLTPYPAWREWAWGWALASLAAAVVLRRVFPILVELSGGGPSWRELVRGEHSPRALPALAVALVVAGVGAGLWSAQQERSYRPAASLPVSQALASADADLAADFFDPAMIVEVRSRAAPDPSAPFESEAAAALDAASHDFAELAALVPGEAHRIDSPASFVLPRAELEARREALTTLKLGARMESLQLLLEDQGLRVEAFAEFVRGAADIDELPSAQAALDGPLGPWISGYLVEPSAPGEPLELRTRVELRGQGGLPAAPMSDAQLAQLPSLRGPAIAAMIDQRDFDDRLSAVLLTSLWLTAFIAWLGTGDFAVALSVVSVAAACEGGVFLALHLLDAAVGPHLLPVFVLVSAAAGMASARTATASARGEAIGLRGLLLSGGCQVVVGIALFTSGQPLWRELGASLAVGCALASVLALLAAPGLAKLLGSLAARLGRGAPPKSQPKSQPKAPELDDDLP